MIYEPDAVFVRRDGVQVTGAERRAANGMILALWRYVIDNPFGLGAS